MIKEIKDILLNTLKTNAQIHHKYEVYAFTNENIDAYLKGVHGKNALSVCSSGDQYLNLINYGFKTIDLMDLNPLTEYYTLGIKQALILAFPYETHKKAITFLLKKSNLEIERKILEYLLLFMSPKYKQFWQIIFTYYFELQDQYQRKINLFQMLTQDYYFNLEEITFYNSYLKSKETYEALKEQIAQVKVHFTSGSILECQRELTYDLILCSNILEYGYYPNLTIKKLKELFEPLAKSLKKDGMLYAAYIYNLYLDKELRTYPIGGADIKGRDLLKEEIKRVSSYQRGRENGVLILRKDLAMKS